MNRRTFLGGLTLGMLSTPVAGEAEQTARAYRIGYLSSIPIPLHGRTHLMEALEQGLRETGFTPGLNLTIEMRSPRSWIQDDEHLRRLAAEMVDRRVDVIVAAWNPAIAAVKRTVANIPVVMIGAVDPVGNGFVSSTSRPGANMTGLTWDIGFAKQFDILKEIIPGLFRIAVLQDPTWGWGRDYWKGAEVAAAARGFKILPFDIHREDDLETAFQKLAQEHSDAILMWDSPLLWRQNNVILNFARTSHLPVMASSKEYVKKGALISYGADVRALFRQAAVYVSKILNGVDPGTLAVERSVTIELAVNIITAQTLGLTIPSSLLQWADEVIH